MAEFKNPLSRSISKSTVLHYCVKKYYFSTYSNYLKEVDMGLWNNAMVAKNIKSLAMWLGECLHDLMSDYLHLLKEKKDTVENIESIKQSLISKMDKDFWISKARDYGKYDSDVKFGLTEHYYKENIDELYSQGKKNIFENFDKFCGSELKSEITQYFQDPENIIFIEPKEKNFDENKDKVLIDGKALNPCVLDMVFKPEGKKGMDWISFKSGISEIKMKKGPIGHFFSIRTLGCYSFPFCTEYESFPINICPCFPGEFRSIWEILEVDVSVMNHLWFLI